MRTPGVDAADFLAGQRGTHDSVADQLVPGGVVMDLVLDAHVAEHLEGALIDQVRTRSVRGPAMLGDHDVRHAERREHQCSRRPGRTRSDDQYVRLDGHRFRRRAWFRMLIDNRWHPWPFRADAASALSRV